MIIRLEDRSTALFPFLMSVPLYGEKIISMIIDDDDSLLIYSAGQPISGILAIERGVSVIAAIDETAAKELQFFLLFSLPFEKLVSDGRFFEDSGAVFLLNRDVKGRKEIEIFTEKRDFSLFERVFDLDFNNLQNKNLVVYSAFLNGERVGGVGYQHLYDGSGMVSLLCTDSRYRGMGVATALLTHLYKEGERLYIMSKNKSSDDFYNRLGLQKFGEYYLYEQFL